MLAVHDTLVRPVGGPLALDLPAARAAALLDHAGRARPPVDGAVYGTLLNDAAALAALGDAVNAPPYRAAPRAPVLYLKPRNTRIGHGDPIPVPAGVESLVMGPALGLVIGRTACRVPEAQALECLAGYVVVNDVSVPHASFYRPSLRFNARDGFCPIGPWVRAANQVGDPDGLGIRVWIDGELRLEADLRGFVRPVARLLAEVTDFMTLQPGDVLMAGVPHGAPLARAGQAVAIEIDRVGRLENRLVAEAQASTATLEGARA